MIAASIKSGKILCLLCLHLARREETDMIMSVYRDDFHCTIYFYSAIISF